MSRIVPVMPPLLEGEIIKDFNAKNCDHSFNGGACEKAVEMYLLRNKINYSIPHIDQGIDLVIEEEGLERAQVKKVVYKHSLDYGMKKRGIIKHRAIFDFRFQTSGNNSPPRTKENTDVFYHVLMTCWRTLIFKVPTIGLTTNPDGAFAKMKNPCLDRASIQRRRQEGTDIRKCLVSAEYSKQVYQHYPEFFLHRPTLFELAA